MEVQQITKVVISKTHSVIIDLHLFWCLYYGECGGGGGLLSHTHKHDTIGNRIRTQTLNYHKLFPNRPLYMTPTHASYGTLLMPKLAVQAAHSSRPSAFNLLVPIGGRTSAFGFLGLVKHILTKLSQSFPVIEERTRPDRPILYVKSTVNMRNGVKLLLVETHLCAE